MEDTTQPMPKTEENGMSIMTVRFVLAVKEASEVPEPICFSTKERIDLTILIKYAIRNKGNILTIIPIR